MFVAFLKGDLDLQDREYVLDTMGINIDDGVYDRRLELGEAETRDRALELGMREMGKLLRDFGDDVVDHLLGVETREEHDKTMAERRVLEDRATREWEEERRWL